MNFTPSQLNELHQLAAAAVDGTIGSGDFRKLVSRLHEDAEARRFFVRFVDMHFALRAASEKKNVSDRLSEKLVATGFDETARQGLIDRKTPVLTGLTKVAKLIPGGEFAVGLLVLAAVTAAFWGLGRRILGEQVTQLDGVDGHVAIARVPEGAPGKKMSASTSIARLTGGVNCFWGSATSLSTADERQALNRGQVLDLVSGVAEIVFTTGTRLTLNGPTRVTLKSEGNCVLHEGQLVALVPQAGVGFVVETPDTKVIDLGTEFGLEVKRGGDTKVHVFQGVVVAEYGGVGENQSPQRVELRKSEAARFVGHQPHFTKFAAAPEQFPRSLNTTAVPRPNLSRWEVAGPAEWTDASNWDTGGVPVDVMVSFGNGGEATISRPVPSVFELALGWPLGIDPSGTVRVVEGGSLSTNGGGDINVGTKASAKTSTLVVEGGALTATAGPGTGALIIGDEPGAHGEVLLSGGLISVGTLLRLGTAGNGQLIIVGSRGTIVANTGVEILGNEGGTATLDVRIDAKGITPITVNSGDTVIKGGNGIASLKVSLIDVPPERDLVLINNRGPGEFRGNGFDDRPDESPISADFEKLMYHWLLSYNYDADSGVDGLGNDVALKFVAITPAIATTTQEIEASQQ